MAESVSQASVSAVILEAIKGRTDIITTVRRRRRHRRTTAIKQASFVGLVFLSCRGQLPFLMLLSKTFEINDTFVSFVNIHCVG